MSRIERSSLIVAAVISIAVHATAAVYIGHYDSLHADQQQAAARIIRISLAAAGPAAPEAEPAPVPAPVPTPAPAPIPTPVTGAEPDPPPHLKPAPESVGRQEEPLPKPVIEPLPASYEVQETAQIIEEHTAPSNHADEPVDKPDLARVSLENEKESYLLRLLAHIDSHKFYPRGARHRGMEGEIQVSFYLLRDGGITDLRVKGGSKVLRKAANQAVHQALSLPPPPASMSLHEQIRFSMVYRLDG